MIKITILFFILLNTASANFNGHWKGSGIYTYPNGTKAECMETYIDLSKWGSKLTFSHDYLICDNLNFVIDSWKNKYTIKNQEIWIGDIIQVGTYSNDKIVFSTSGMIDEMIEKIDENTIRYTLYEGYGGVVEFELYK